MNKNDFLINKSSENDSVEITKLPINVAVDTKAGCLRLYCRQYPSAFVLQLRTIDKKGKTIYASMNISDKEILAMAEYVKNESDLSEHIKK
ncbi:MAG: hypothetical protein PHT07_24010 [Paludibacter sp.]|nr:hypothetical protein [Paludibacter sp.]